MPTFFYLGLHILYHNRLRSIATVYKKGVVKVMQSPVEFFKNLPKKECSECGQIIEEQAESYLMECDYCLSKRPE